MPRPRTGYAYEENGKWYARLSYTDQSGRHTRRRRARNKTHAHQLLRQLIGELEDESAQPAIAPGTFQEMADWYRQNYAQEAVYSGEHKVSGLRGLRTVLYRLKLLEDHFGHLSLGSLGYEDIRAYKLKRLGERTPRGRFLSLASVHRELALLRRVLQLAVQQGRIAISPFSKGDALIVKAHEAKRTRTLSLDEETRLLYYAADERTHLRPIIICALDTGMRAGEIFSLRWADVSLPRRLITLQALNTKTLTTRQIPISARLAHELKKLWQARSIIGDGRVFGIQRSISKAWKTLTRNANVLDLRFHDLRHAFASRLAESDINPLVIALVMGHSQQGVASMTLHYTHLTEPMAEKIRVALAAIDEERIGQAQSVSANRVRKR